MSIGAFIYCQNLPAAADESPAVKQESIIQNKDLQHKESPTVLNPDQFFGQPAEAYRAARSCPEILSHLFPYCGVDQTDNEHSLLDSFTTIHAVDDPVCRDEAILASKLNAQKVPLAEIQKAIDEKFEHHYPFNKPSQALQAYRAARGWKPVQDPNKYFGATKEAYRQAQSCPEVLSHLFPYCGIDVGAQEHSLLDSFTTEHAVDDPVCRDEAIMASKLNAQKVPLADIQKAIDEKFAPIYPYSKPSPALQAYRAGRLWQPVADSHSNR